MNKYDMAMEFLGRTASRGIVPGLSRIETLLGMLGDPQNAVPVIHVSGTNGKGSFSAMLSAVLSRAGFRTGSFSSPALTGATDSFRIDGGEITGEKFAEIILDIAPLWEKMNDKPTEFEVLTAAAYELFRRENCDIAIVECGLGGDEDSTNVISSPLLSVITNVSRDHCGILGNTTAEIASHKAGIIKSGRPVFFGGSDEAALEVISGRAKALGAPLYTPDSSKISLISDNRLTGTEFTYCGRNYTLALLGSYQLRNALNVLSCVDILRVIGMDIPEKAVSVGLAEVRWHGRFELLSSDPVIIIDGAHNPDGVACAAQSIKQYFDGGPVLLLMGVMADKEYQFYPELLGGLAARVFTVRPDNPRSLDSAALAEVFSAKGIPAEAFTDLSEGVKCAVDTAKETGLPLVALGSLYMYRQFTQALRSITE
jgi:dihydrofolate synthase/folylpolyglutamate synthase